MLDEILTAHGGLERWQSATALTAHATFGGLIRSRMPGNRMADVTVRVEMAEQRAVFSDFPTTGRRAVFDRGSVRIESDAGDVLESRENPRALFTGVSGLRRNLRWDALDATYFAGYAWWNYLTTPLLLTRDDVELVEGEPWRDGSETWRRLHAHFPAELHTHSPHQTFYVNPSGFIRRHDYTAQPVGRWARAAHYMAAHRVFGGLVFPTYRRVYPRGPRGQALPAPTLVALDIERVDVETR